MFNTRFLKSNLLGEWGRVGDSKLTTFRKMEGLIGTIFFVIWYLHFIQTSVF